MASTLGYKPASMARGVGTLDAGRAKATYIGGFTKGVWVREIGFRGGRTGATVPNAAAALWDWDPVGVGAPTTLIYSPPVKSINARMAPNDRATGINYFWKVTNLPLVAGRKMAIGIWVDDSPGGQIAYGQNASGARMYRDNTAPSVPNPFGVTFSTPEGNIDAWVTAVENERPTVTIADPPVGGTVDTIPTVTIRYTDPNAVDGDYIDAFLIEFWDEDNTSKLASSGITPTNGTQQTAGELTWTAPELTPGIRTIRAYVYDRLGLASLVAQRTVTVASGGHFANLQVGGVVGQSGANNTDVVTIGNPSLFMTWQHDDGANLEAVEMRMRGTLLGSVVRGPYTWDPPTTVPPNTDIELTFNMPEPDWANLAPSTFRYRWEVRGTDSNGGQTGWVSADPFYVNNPPEQPSQHVPASGSTFTGPPSFSVVLDDYFDGSARMQDVEFEVEYIPTGETFTIDAVYSGIDRVWVESPALTSLLARIVWFADKGNGAYRWRVLGTDPWGATFNPPDTWHTFDIVDPPAITMVYPTDGQTIANGAPTIDYTVDRPQTHHRIRLLKAPTNTPMINTQKTATSSTEFDVPAGLLDEGDYILQLTVWTSDGLETTVIVDFTLDYPPFPALTGAVIEQQHSSIFDIGGVGLPEQTPNVYMAWNAVSTATVSDEAWRGYRVRRTAMDGTVDVWEIPDRNETEFIDTSTKTDQYTYELYYVGTVNDGADTITSTPIVEVEAVRILYTLLRSPNANDLAVTLHYWDDRGDTDDPDTVSIDGWEEKPFVFQGPKDAMVISGRFEVWDHPNNEYTAQDIVATLREMKRAESLGNNVYRSRQFWYVDPTGRTEFVRMTGLRVRDQHDGYRTVIDIDFEAFGYREDVS